MEDNIFDKVHEVDMKKTMEEFYIDYAKVRAASYFKVFLLSWRPCLYVTRFYFKVGKVT